MKREELRGIIERGQGMPEGTPLAAYLYMVVGANKAEYKELVEMSNAFEEAMEECGFAAKWEDRGLEKAVKKLQKYGMDPAEIARALELPLNTVSRYLSAEHV